MKSYWAQGKRTDKNITLAWVKQIRTDQRGILRIACASFAQIFADGVLIGAAPCRAAHGMARIMQLEIPPCETLAIIVAGYNCNSYWLVDEPPFCMAEYQIGEKKIDLSDFICVHLDDRIQKVAKFSYQRAYIEDYDFDGRRARLLLGDINTYTRVVAEEVMPPVLLSANTSVPKLNFHQAKLLQDGAVKIKASDMKQRVSEFFAFNGACKGFLPDEWEDDPIDVAARIEYNTNGDGSYRLYDLGRAISGFMRLFLHVESDTDVYLTFDEIMSFEIQNGQSYQKIDFMRNATASVIKWRLKPGAYILTSFEPYSARYMNVTWFGKIVVNEIGIIDYENPDADRFFCRVKDRKIQAILEAARQTFKQNAVDLLTDCPSRERAGWLSDSWFSSSAERLFTGKNLVEDAFLENYVYAKTEGLPSGMIPMCYPADHNDGTFIPNWAMWYILEIYKNFKVSGSRAQANAARKNIEGILHYFEKKENEFGLLEDLEGWVFVEWSAANEKTHLEGVNLPTNMCWAKCLECIAKLYNMPQLQEKSKKIKDKIIEIGFDGEFFTDNCIRDDNGKLVRTGLKTEVCQYYAFWFETISLQSHPQLYRELKENFGPWRKRSYRQDISEPNAMYGIYMRLDLLMREGDVRRLTDECVKYFYKMAERTGTLWEHNSPHASCIHGFASYAAIWLVFALTGWNGESFCDDWLGTDCIIKFPIKNEMISVQIKDGKRAILRA